jgi:hypothetical protein
MTAAALSPERWQALLSRSEEFTCYSAAVGVWLAVETELWAAAVNPGLWLTVTDEPDGLLGFGYFPPALRARLGLIRAGADDPQAALAGVLDELARSGRVIVAADGYHLPWHVACGREHVPHWFTLTGAPDQLEVADPFACRNELGVQTPEHHSLDAEALTALLPAIPGTNAVHRLREELAFGDRSAAGLELGHQWFAASAVSSTSAPAGTEGPAAIRRLAEHFEARGQDPAAYAQADDIWSIARHRAFLVRYAESLEEPEAAGWVAEHGAALARRWAHIAPLLMQAVLSLRIGRTASPSVSTTLSELAEREDAAAQALPAALSGCSITADRGEGHQRA